MRPIKIGIVGLGKVAQDQHVPTLRSSDAFELVGAASLENRLSGAPNFLDLQSLAKAVPDLEAVALCTPPQARFEIAREALERGFHVLLEKPPAVTVGEAQALIAIAKRNKVTLFASWHSRHAPAVALAREWMSQRRLRRLTVTWKEDVRVWHPGQKWIWSAGGLGVFDPGINALSILTHLVPGLMLKKAELTFPQNCATPVAAKLLLSDSLAMPVEVELDFLQQGPPTWDIIVDNDEGSLTLSMGGKLLSIAGAPVFVEDTPEYCAVYSHFAGLIRGRRCDVDLAPLQLVADAFLCGRRLEGLPFIE